MATDLELPQRFQDAHEVFTADLRSLGTLHEVHEVAYSQSESGRRLSVSLLPDEPVDAAFERAVSLLGRLVEAGEPVDASDDEGRCVEWGIERGRVSVSIAMNALLRLHVFLRVEDGPRAIHDLLASAPVELAELCASLGEPSSISTGCERGSPYRWSAQGRSSEPSDAVRERLLAAGFQPMPSGRALSKSDLGVQFRADNGWAVVQPAPSFL